MKRWKKYAAGLLVTAGLSSQAHAQVPAAPVAVAPATAPVAAAPAPAPANIWTFLCLSPEQKAACKAKLCGSALGQMLNNGLAPMSTFSGGLIPQCCPLVSPADLAKPADSAEGAAARAKADEADAKARRAAVRFLGTVDCHYWPEAQEALINALRGDRNECVRLEAAFALNRGCCCTKMIIKALVMTVSGSDEDGFPSERSGRVRAVAQSALAHCLECYTEVIPVPPEKGPGGKEPVPPPIPMPPAAAKPLNGPATLPANITQEMTPAEYYKRVQAMSRQEIITDSQRVLAKLPPLSAPIQAPQDSSPSSVFDLVQYAFGSGGSSSTTTVSETTTIIAQTPVSSPAVAVKTDVVVPPTTPVKKTPVVERAPAAPVVVSGGMAPAPARAMPSMPATVSQAQPVHQPAAAANTRDSGMNMTMAQVVQTLRQSPYPEYRDWAADNLSTVDGLAHPEVVQALVSGARSDQVPTVRAACVRALGKMRCGTMVVMNTMQAAKTDPDSRVRHEADTALQLLSGVDPAALKVPSGH